MQWRFLYFAYSGWIGSFVAPFIRLMVGSDVFSLIGIKAHHQWGLRRLPASRHLGADMLLLLTDVDAVYLDFGKPDTHRIGKRA